MKTMNTLKLKRLTRQGGFLFAVISLLVLNSCDKKEVLVPQEPQLPELTDPIPYDELSSGTIVFERTGPYPGEYSGCYVIDVDQRKTWALDFGLAGDYCVSPDGQKIAFTMYSGDESAYDVYCVNIDGTHLGKLDALEGQDRFPSWSPDGSKIFFWLDAGPPALYSCSPSANATDLRKLRELNTIPSGAFSVSPEGRVAFVGYGYQKSGLYTLDTNGTNLDRIVPMPEGWDFESPVFSLDGQKIAYLRVWRDSLSAYQKIDLMEVSVEGGSPVLLASLNANGSKEWADNGKFNSVYLARSPDGSKFLVNLPEGDFVSHLYLLNSDGSNLTQVTFAKGVTDRCVSWGR